MQILNPTPGTVYNGVIQGTYRIARGEGILNLWRGMSSVVVGAGPAHAVYFATYEAVKHVMGGNQAGMHHPLAAGKDVVAASSSSVDGKLTSGLHFSDQWSMCNNCERCADEPLRR